MEHVGFEAHSVDQKYYYYLFLYLTSVHCIVILDKLGKQNNKITVRETQAKLSPSLSLLK